MKLRKIIGLLSIAPLSGLSVFAPVVAASTPTVYTSPSKVTIADQGQVSLAVRINPNGATLDTVNVVVKYPTASLRYTGLSTAGSAFSSFVPSEPTADNGTVTFAAAKFKPDVIRSDSAIATLNFTATAASGTAQVKFDGSQAARAGKAIALASTPTSVSFGPAGSSDGQATISGVRVSDITKSGGTVQWQTDVPTTSSVAFGNNGKYSFTKNDDTLTTTHSLKLDGSFAPNTKVFYTVSGKTADGQTSSSDQQAFTTSSDTIQLADKDSGRPLAWQYGVAVIILGLVAVVAFEAVHLARRRRSAD